MRSSIIGVAFTSLLLITQCRAQTSAPARPHARIVQAIDESATITAIGNVHPLAAQAFAQGLSTPVDEGMPMQHMILHLTSDTVQETQLAQLLTQQNDPKSPLYHRYLTPEDFGLQFGVAAADIAQVSNWLQGHGFTIEQLTAGNRSIIFSGNAGQVARAFQTRIHSFTVNGERHYSNVTDPRIPAAFAGVVGGIVQLNDFQAAHKLTKATPITAVSLGDPQYSSGDGHYVSPADFATIYDLNPLYSAGINGAGQSIAIVSRANISIADVDTFRGTFGLPANDPQVIIATNDPGMEAGGNTMEATLDTEWAGAVAPKATIKLVVGQCTNSGDGITQAETYAVNNNVAPIISVSYGLCEAAMGTTYVQYMSALWEQAAAQGQSVFVSSGDTGAAGCNSQSDSSATVAGVNGLCSSPYSTCVGGSEFVEGSNPAQYWQPGSDTTGGSAISYIPETTWNESAANGGAGLIGGGGGASIVFGKPSWQTGLGVPSDGRRDVPDVALTAAQHDGYAVYEYEGGLMFAGGTSFSAPSFAGLMALVNQKAGARQGLANPALYVLAAKQASGGAAVFHDITTGNNSVPGVTGFSAGTGYDMATGLGSVDGAVLVNHWSDGLTSLSLTASSGSLSMNAGQTLPLTITSMSGLNAAVTLSVSGLPSGVTPVFSPATIASPGSGSTVLTLATNTAAKQGSYILVITASSAGQTATLGIPLVIAAPSFTLVPSTTTITSALPSSTPVTLTTSAQTGFSAALALSVSGAPAGVTTALSSKSIAAPGNGSSVLTIAVTTSAIPGTYQLTVTATGGSQAQTAHVSLYIPSFSVTAPSGYYSTTAGGTVTFPVTVTPQPGFSSTIALKPRAGYLPSGVTTSFSPASVSGSATSTSTVTMNVAKSLPNGAYPFFVDGAGGNITQGAYEWLLVGIQGSCTLAVYDPTYSSSIIPVTAGKSTTGEEVCLWPQGAFSGPLTVTFSNVPAGITVTPAASLYANGNFVGLNVSVDQNVMPGNYQMLIHAASSGGYTGSYTFTAAVTGNSFALTGAQSALTITQGTAATFSATTLHNGIFNSAVTLAWSGLPSGVTASLAKSSFAAPGDGTAVTTFTAASSAAPGTYTATVTATGGGITRTWPVSLTIAPPSCAFAASARSLALAAGQSSSIQLSCGSVLGKFSAPLALSVTGAPEGVTVQSPATLTPASTATLQLGSSISLAATAYNLSITASNNNYSSTLPVSVTLAASNFTMTSAANSLNITAGVSGQVNATIVHHGVFNSAVSLAWSGLPTGITPVLSKSSLAAPGDGTVSTTFNVAYSTTPGTYTATLTATGGGITQTNAVAINVAAGPSCTLHFGFPVLPTIINPGGSYTFGVNCGTVTGTFATPLALSVSGTPTGATTKFSAAALTTTSVVQVTVSVPQNITVTSFTLQLTAASSGFSTTVGIPFTINLNDFMMAAPVNAVNIKQGSSGQLNMSTTALGAFNSSIYLYYYSLPAGVTASLSAYPIPAPGSGTSATTFTVATTAKPGTYTFNLTGVGYGGLVHTVPVTLTISSR